MIVIIRRVSQRNSGQTFLIEIQPDAQRDSAVAIGVTNSPGFFIHEEHTANALRSPSVGPIVGHVTATSARIWMRGDESDDSRTVGIAALYRDGVYVAGSAQYLRLRREYDRTGIAEFTGLTADAGYVVRTGSPSLNTEDPNAVNSNDEVFLQLPPPESWLGQLEALVAEENSATFRAHPAAPADTLSFVFGSCRYPGLLWAKKRADQIFKGTLGNFVQELDGDVSLHSRENKLYILKEYVGGSGHYSYSWRAILDNRLQQSIDLDFTLQRVCPPPRLDAGTNAGCESSVTYYRLSLDQGYFNSKIEIRQEQGRKAFKYYIDKKEGGVLKAEHGIGSPKLISAVSSPVSLFSPAFAQSLARTPDSVARRFHSTDPLIRRDAAREFAALGKVGTDWIKRGFLKERPETNLDWTHFSC